MALTVTHSTVVATADDGTSDVGSDEWNANHTLAGFGTGVTTWLETPSSANLAAAVTDETGSGALMFGTAPTITTGATITGGTVTVSTPVIDATQTWNAGAVTFTGLKLSITSTASATASKLIDFVVGSESPFSVRKDGAIILPNLSTASEYIIRSATISGDDRLIIDSTGTPFGSRLWIDTANDGPAFSLAEAGAEKLAFGSVTGGYGISLYSSLDFAIIDKAAGNITSLFLEQPGYNLRLPSGGTYSFSSTTQATGTADIGLARNAAGVLEVNNGTAGTFRDLKARDVFAKGIHNRSFFYPQDNEPPTTNFATLDTRNSHPVLDFDDTTAEAAIFTGVLQHSYNGGGITVQVAYSATATSGTAGWTVEIERIGDSQLDIDGDSFASAQTITAVTVPGTTGHVDVVSVNITDGANMDSVAAGEQYRIRVKRDVANDTAVGDNELHWVSVRET